MARLLYRVGAFAARMHWLVIGVWIVVFCAVLGSAALLGGTLQASFSIPGTQSQIAIDMLSERFPAASGASVNAIFQAPPGSTVQAQQALISQMATQAASLDHVSMVKDPFASGNSAQISTDNQYAYITIGYDIPTTQLGEEENDALNQLVQPARDAGMTVAISGVPDPSGDGNYSQEVGGLIVAYLILAITFGSLLAAGMPPITAIIGVGIGTGLINIAAAFATVSSTAPVLASMLGLAVGIDYGLFIVSRHRAQLARGMDPQESVAHAVATAGSAVIFAGLTVIIALLGLAVVGIPFVTVMGQGAALAVVMALLIGVTLIPALLGLFGTRLVPKPNSRMAKRERHLDDVDATHLTMGARWVRLVTAKPVVTVLIGAAALIGLTLPAAHLELTLPDAGYNALGTQSREAYDMLSEGYGPGFNGPLLVTADLSHTTDIQGALNALGSAFTGLPDVHAVSQAVPNPGLDMAIVSITPDSAPDSQATKDLVSAIRAMEPQFESAHGFDYLVTGNTAVGIDVSAQLQAALLPFGLVVVGLCVILLAIVFRSIAVPISATLGFLLSVGTSFGVTTAVFNNGIGASLVGVDKVGPVISFMPILVMAVLFGLAMDYEVFLVSRMREEFSRTRDARFAVTHGFAGAARVVTAAALIMFSVFASFVPGGGAVLQPIAFALAIGVLVDAFVVRMTLIPAVMMLLGPRAWWIPRWLERILPDVDIEGEGVEKLKAAQAWSLAVTRAEDDEMEPAPAVIELFVRIDDERALSARASSGDVLVLPRDGEGLLAAITGRGPTPDGHLRVAGCDLPFDAGTVRRITILAGMLPPITPALSVGDYVHEQTALDAPRGHQRRHADLAYRYLDELGRIETTYGSWQGSAHGALASLRPVDRWRLDVAIAIASERPVLALTVGPLDAVSARALLAEACALAAPTTTIVIAANGPVSFPTRREIVTASVVVVPDEDPAEVTAAAPSPGTVGEADSGNATGEPKGGDA